MPGESEGNGSGSLTLSGAVPSVLKHCRLSRAFEFLLGIPPILETSRPDNPGPRFAFGELAHC